MDQNTSSEQLIEEKKENNNNVSELVSDDSLDISTTNVTINR